MYLKNIYILFFPYIKSPFLYLSYILYLLVYPFDISRNSFVLYPNHRGQSGESIDNPRTSCLTGCLAEVGSVKQNFNLSGVQLFSTVDPTLEVPLKAKKMNSR